LTHSRLGEEEDLEAVEEEVAVGVVGVRAAGVAGYRNGW
jgi:hypothetical protein